jgi:uncharacterized protein YeaO (DUF488 family)
MRENQPGSSERHTREGPEAAGDARVRLKRIYEPSSPDDGERILVDRLWPRGVSKAKAALDAWMKDVAPSTELRRWFGHDPARWEEFQQRYRQELAARPAALQPLVDAAEKGPVTLLYAARDEQHNEAVVLQQVIEARLRPNPEHARRSG